MSDLLNVRSSLERASRRKKRGEAAVDLIATQGLQKKVRQEDGFTIHASNLIPELKKARIDAPAGLMTVFSTYDGMRIYESDYYLGSIYSSGDLKTFDYALNRYAQTGTGVDSWFSILIQGQSEKQIIDAIPYANTTTTQFARNATSYNVDPLGDVVPESYQYPDSWPSPLLNPLGSTEECVVGIPGTDLIFNSTLNAVYHSEISKIGHLSKNDRLGGRTTFSYQLISGWRPTVNHFSVPSASGFEYFIPSTYLDFPFESGRRHYASWTRLLDEVYSYDRLFIDSIIHPESDVPALHTGPGMPDTLRDILLSDESCSCRPNNFYVFKPAVGVNAEGEEIRPIVFFNLDMTSTDNPRHSDNPPDVAYFEDEANAEERKWRLSCHWLDMTTGETWGFTAAQFWDVLRDRVMVLTIQEDWRLAPSNSANNDGWRAAMEVFNQFFGRPQHNFIVPHDTWTFHAEDSNIYAWNRYYGAVRIERQGLFALLPTELVVPDVVTSTEGIRPTIRYSGVFWESETPRYICACEKLERATPEEDLPQGQKEIISLHVGSPFTEDGWLEFGEFVVEREDERWTLCHVRIAYHEQAGEDIDSIMLLGIARRLFLKDEVETIEYYSAILQYNTQSGGSWTITAKYSNINTIDPVFGERWSADLSIFGDEVISRKMMKYLSPPTGASQQPFGPYSGYYRGLP